MDEETLKNTIKDILYEYYPRLNNLLELLPFTSSVYVDYPEDPHIRVSKMSFSLYSFSNDLERCINNDFVKFIALCMLEQRESFWHKFNVINIDNFSQINSLFKKRRHEEFLDKFEKHFQECYIIDPQDNYYMIFMYRKNVFICYHVALE